MLFITYSYEQGCDLALRKLGTVAGPIAYAERENRNEFDFSQDKAEDLWREMDQEPSVTGEESGLGMPSAGGIGKSAADDYAASSGDVYGSFDHNASKPQKDHIISSAKSQAFKANEDYDQSYGMGEPAMTQPQGSKYAQLGLLAKRLAEKRAAMNPLSGGSAPISMGANLSVGNVTMPSIKPPTIPKAKIPGNNSLANMHQNAGATLGQASLNSNATRAIGSPLQ
jgi:hypothetical protein